MRIFLILVALFLLLAILVAFDAYYWTHVSARAPDGPSTTAQLA